MNTMTTTVTDWSGSLWHGLTAGLDRFANGVPTVLGALLIIGWIIAGALAAVTKLCHTAHVDTLADHAGVNDLLSRSGTRMKASDILGAVIKWVVRLVFLEVAAEQCGLTQVTTLVNGILAYTPKIIVSLLLLGVGAFLGNLLAGIVRGAASEAGMGNPNLLGKLASGAVMAFAIIAAVNELGVAPVVVNTLYIGLVAALSLALGLSFGPGGKDAAGKLTEQWMGQAQQTAQRAAKPGLTTDGGASTGRAGAARTYEE